MGIGTYITRLLLSLMLVVSVLAVAAPAYARTDPFKGLDCASAPDSAVCKREGGDPITGPTGIVQRTANLIALLAGVFAVIMIVIAGITYITSNGDNEAIAKAKRILIFSAIGLVVIVLARFIIRYVVNLVV